MDLKKANKVLSDTAMWAMLKTEAGEKHASFNNSKVVANLEASIKAGELEVGSFPVRVATNTKIPVLNGPPVEIKHEWTVPARHILKSCPSEKQLPVYAAASILLSTTDANKARQEFMADAIADSYKTHGKPAGAKTSRSMGVAAVSDDLIS